MIPGEVTPADAPDILLNAGRRRQVLVVRNTGDRGIQVGSHFHFFEVNRALEFDRGRSLGMRLDIPAGTAVRFEPGAEQKVTLVDFGGAGGSSASTASSTVTSTHRRPPRLRTRKRSDAGSKAQHA